eukprot:m.64158 g.64158  ORF g.64158 m.64158 type:complete len:310 (+) comp11626_c0_seq3:186-1115(+)
MFNLRYIPMTQLAADLHWPNLVLALLFLLAVHFGMHPSTSKWPITEANHGLYDFPKPSKELFPSWVLFFNAVAFSVIIGLVERFLNQSHRGWSRTIFAWNVIFGLWTALFFTLGLTTVGKHWVSEPRPDFMRRCRPDGNYVYDKDGIVICNGNLDEIEDGLKSFPSGHSSSAMVVGVFCTLYLMWTMYYRDIVTVFHNGTYRPGAPHWNSVLRRHIAQILFLLLSFPLVLGLAIASSRLIDHRHSPADVVAGAFLGTIVAVVLFSRVVTESDFEAEHTGREDSEQREDREQREGELRQHGQYEQHEVHV